MKINTTKLLESIEKELNKSVFFKNHQLILLCTDEFQRFDFVLVNTRLKMSEIFVEYSTNISSITEFISLTIFNHQFCQIEDLQQAFVNAFKNLEEGK